jgi:hypothetical protein
VSAFTRVFYREVSTLCASLNFFAAFWAGKFDAFCGLFFTTYTFHEMMSQFWFIKFTLSGFDLSKLRFMDLARQALVEVVIHPNNT